MIKWSRFLNPLENRGRLQIRGLSFMKKLICLLLLLFCGCSNFLASSATRENFSDTLSRICKNKYQAFVTSKVAGDTIWVYLAYTTPRSGRAATKDTGKDLYLEYEIASFNPYRTMEPAELKFLTQKVLGDMRRLLLSMPNPYKFFSLVVVDISNPKNGYEHWYIGYINDLKNYAVCKDFSGEGYNRLVFHQEKVGITSEDLSESYRDINGQHVNYHDVTLREFVDKQIKWRIYKRFTIEYNKTPFDITSVEKEEEVISIVKKVFMAYNFKEFDSVYLRDSSFLDEQKSFKGYNPGELEKYRPSGASRKPAF